MNPFKHPPRFEFLKRMFLPTIGVFLICLSLAGIGENFRHERTARVWPSRAATQLLTQTFDYWKNEPAACRGDQAALTDFERHQCEEFLERIRISTCLSIFPIFAALGFLLFGFKRLDSFYRLSARTITVGKPMGRGGELVWDGRDDFFAWSYCLRKVQLTLESGSSGQGKLRITAYLPEDFAIPPADQPLSVYTIGNRLGAARYIAVPYLPYLAVLSGSR